MVKAKSGSERKHHSQGRGGSSVKSLRFELGLSRVDLAKLSGLSEKTVDRIESGNQSSRETTTRKIFNALNKARAKEGLANLAYEDLFPSGAAEVSR
jgi:predicted transcriptional regulator